MKIVQSEDENWHIPSASPSTRTASTAQRLRHGHPNAVEVTLGAPRLDACSLRVLEPVSTGTSEGSTVAVAEALAQELCRSLPQDPVRFSGPLRENLDPFNEYADARIWAVLQQVHMADNLHRWGAGLDFEVDEGGDNLSVGQQKLLCIGRALIKKSTSWCWTDQGQRRHGHGRAHSDHDPAHVRGQDRIDLRAPYQHDLHCGKIAVMDAGRVTEFGSPSGL
ncbi:unnamed protein product [Phytophthora lilii]|uniref:Unnamed protein product n=1 Tax=Phytophthora lilii TaxID=2077276 RepID=A0A9W6TH44_9STRA|nr:unnamed protein product [Phytophthora lilii]